MVGRPDMAERNHAHILPRDTDSRSPLPTKEASASHAVEEFEWNPALTEALFGILVSDAGQSELDLELQKIERVYHDVVYSELIYLLSHLRFEPEEAKRHWQSIIQHRDAMRKQLGASVDVRVALVSYFVQVSRMLQNPKVIELQLFEKTQASVYWDELTGLHNFRFFKEYLSREVEKRERSGSPLSLVMIDIDDFKVYNDRNGHEAGNEALTTVARLLTESLRKMDIAVRYGGEEFAIILPATPKSGAQLVAERARESIERHCFPHGSTQPQGKVTLSLGVATCPIDARDASELVQRADHAMYAAKASGKNRVQVYGQGVRSYQRTSASLAGRFRMLATDSRPLTAVNISEGGFLFLTDVKLPPGSLVEIDLVLPESKKEITMSARVIHIKEKERGTFEVGVRSADMSRNDGALLAGYMRSIPQGPQTEGPETPL
jgi:diguanylate cyclase (GGDEF)-like protein